jgi:hypothetical protein
LVNLSLLTPLDNVRSVVRSSKPNVPYWVGLFGIQPGGIGLIATAITCGEGQDRTVTCPLIGAAAAILVAGITWVAVAQHERHQRIDLPRN